MNRSIVIVESDEAGLRAALVRDRRLEAIEIDAAASPSLVGAIGPARIIRDVAAIGTIIRLADGPELLLSREKGQPHAPGADILVQVVRDADGGKLGTASAEISLAGRALVHLPGASGMSVSRRLDLSPERRTDLERALRALPGGWIARRGAGRLEPDKIVVEAIALAAEAAALPEPKTPPDAFRRLMANQGGEAIQQIAVSGRAALGAVERWCEAFAPELAPLIEFHEPGAKLFDAHDLDNAIDALRGPHVPLPDGGSLMIEPTAALTAIDVNAGAGANILAVNLGAAAEIARQLRLRHIGGLIVIDFVSMPRPRDGAKIGQALASALADDAAQTHILAMSRFGLIEMTRERRGPRLALPR
jgi:ribonuclease G